MATFETAGIKVTRATAAAASVSATLDAPAAGQCTKIVWITCFSTGATAADVDVQKNDGTSIARVGGAGIGILSAPIRFDDGTQPRGGLCCAAADATKVVLTTTAGNPTTVSIGYVMVPA